MNEDEPKPLDYAPPPRKERWRLLDLSLADWIIVAALMVVVLWSLV